MVTLYVLILSSYAVNSQQSFMNDFNGTSINQNRTIVNPNLPSPIALTGTGELNIIATATNGGSD